MNLLINAARGETRGPMTESGIYLPSSRGFIDDLTLTTATHVQARWMLAALTDVASWGRMKFKAVKSRSLVIKKGQTTERFKLYVQNEEIPSIVTNPTKCLGKWFDASLHDRDKVRKLERQLEDDLKKIDRFGLTGKFKAWLYQHALLPRLIWPLMLYEVPNTTVEALERITSRHLRKWLGVPPSFTSIGLYGKTNKLQLPLSSLVEEFKVAKSRLVLTLRDSPDELIHDAGDTRKTQTAQPTLQNRSVGSSTAQSALQNCSVGSSILGGTTGWNIELDLGKRRVFPDVVQTTLRPDIVLWSKTGKKLIVIELTVPWETRCEEAYERKKAKYTELLDLCKEKGWRTWLFPVEVCVRGFCSYSVCRRMTAVGTSDRDKKRAIQRSSRTSAKLAVAETRGDELEAINQRQ